MTIPWGEAETAFTTQIQVNSIGNNEPVIVSGHTVDFYCIGIGTDAAVFRHVNYPNYAFKVYVTGAMPKKDIEQDVYKQIEKSSYFPQCYGSGSNFLVLSFESGKTLYECLLLGIHIPKQVIQDIDDARNIVRSKGLNPRDIHLKNILVKDGRAKLIDVSEYVNPGNDLRWEHLKRGYNEYYPSIDGKKIPLWMLETVKSWYNQQKSTKGIDEIIKRVVKFLRV